jgi:hypothetical protein
MKHAEDGGRRGRRRRLVSEKPEIVQLTMEAGASVAEIARAHGVNANQVFKWRRLFETVGHYGQLCASWKNPDPIRRHYYDSGANEGIGFYSEEMMLQAGLYDDSPLSSLV